LFIHGGSDYRDPLTQSEQMYLSLRVLGVETGLIVYPGQSHGIGPPSYRTDLLRRYALWFDKYVKGEAVDPLYAGFGQD
jgi:dipeptidyl aminopeptidase/acylaminoacyl peptidase